MKNLIGPFMVIAAVVLSFVTTKPSIANPGDLAVFPFPTNFTAQINPTNFVWGVQSSTDCVHWVWEAYEVDSNNCFVVHERGRDAVVFRWAGYPR